jgi:hypothetical protein
MRNLLYKAFSFIAESKIRAITAASNDPGRAQWAKLKQILNENQHTQFGRQHNFAGIKSVHDYRNAVPMRDYEGFRSYIESAMAGEKGILTAEDPVMFATTSGTTGSPKYIPITRGYMEEFRLASVVSGYHLLRSFPSMANGVTLSIVSPAEEGRTEGGIPYGAISGQLFKHEPFLIKKFISPIPYEVFLVKDYETRYYLLLRLAVALPLSCFYTLNPSTIALLCRRLQSHEGRLIKDVRDGTVTPPGNLKLPAETFSAIKHLVRPDRERALQLLTLAQQDQFTPEKIWPTLQVVSCWTKAAASFYLADFPKYFGKVPVCDITYGASEGRGTVFMGPGQQMAALNSHFFEFVPEAEIDQPNPTILLAEELENGQNYYILFTTSGGLFRYHINDVMKVVGFYNRAPLLEFQYKGGNVCSFSGEKITELQVTAAMTRAADVLNVRSRFFTVIPRFSAEPYYELWIEPIDDRSKLDTQHIARAFDTELSALNIEYKTKRDSQRLGPVQVKLLTAGTYEAFRRHLAAGGVADAQIKVSHLNPKSESRQFFEKNLLMSYAPPSTTLLKSGASVGHEI